MTAAREPFRGIPMVGQANTHGDSSVADRALTFLGWVSKRAGAGTDNSGPRVGIVPETLAGHCALVHNKGARS